MSLLDILTHPVTRELWAGVQYTAPRVLKAWQEHSAPKPVTEADVAAAASQTAAPDFGDVTDVQPKEVSNHENPS
jgi:hypothetical protein